MQPSQKEKRKNSPTHPYRKWIFALLLLALIGFGLSYAYGERAVNKLQRIALQLNLANQQLAAMQDADIVLVTFNPLASDYSMVNLTADLDGYARFPTTRRQFIIASPINPRPIKR